VSLSPWGWGEGRRGGGQDDKGTGLQGQKGQRKGVDVMLGARPYQEEGRYGCETQEEDNETLWVSLARHTPLSLSLAVWVHSGENAEGRTFHKGRAGRGNVWVVLWSIPCACLVCVQASVQAMVAWPRALILCVEVKVVALVVCVSKQACVSGAEASRRRVGVSYPPSSPFGLRMPAWWWTQKKGRKTVPLFLGRVGGME